MSENNNLINEIIEHNIANIYPSKEALTQKLTSGEKLVFYLGIDPTIPDVHLGHAVIYKKLEQIRQLGHTVIFLIGDFTARIGDPTDQTSARVQMTEEQVKQNAAVYKAQIAKVLQFDDPVNPATIKFNSDWLSPLTFTDLIELSANFTLQQMIERDMFQERLKENKPIYMHEFFYPFMQGYDSVAMNVDVELGGTDQTFNMLAGRELMKKLRGKDKFVMTCEFLMGLDGNKMSKSKGNFISLNDEPFEMYRKIMTIHDDLIGHYYDMIFNQKENQLTEQILHDPMRSKKELAYKIVTWLYSETEANSAQEAFESVVQKGSTPDEINEVPISEAMLLVDFLAEHNLVTSKSEARRLIEQGGVVLDTQKVTDISFMLNATHTGKILRVGKSLFVKLL